MCGVYHIIIWKGVTCHPLMRQTIIIIIKFMSQFVKQLLIPVFCSTLYIYMYTIHINKRQNIEIIINACLSHMKWPLYIITKSQIKLHDAFSPLALYDEVKSINKIIIEHTSIKSTNNYNTMYKYTTPNIHIIKSNATLIHTRTINNKQTRHMIYKFQVKSI